MALLGNLDIVQTVDEVVPADRQGIPKDLPGDVPEPKWWLSENIPGHGERPDYLQDKYKTVADQAKAYVEAQKALGATQGAPEKYEWGEMAEYIDVENQHLKELTEWAKSNRISQEAMQMFTKKFVDYAESNIPNEEEEIKKIDKDKLEMTQNWAKSSFTPETLRALDKIPLTVENINMLSEIRHATLNAVGRNFATSEKSQQARPQSVAEIKSEIQLNYAKYSSDRAYNGEMMKKMQAAIEREVRA